MRKTFAPAWAAAAAATLLAAPAAHAVTFGSPDGSAHPYVGTILFQTPGGVYSCTATQLSPTLLLTAGHCTAEGGVPNQRTWFKAAASISFPGRASYASLAAYLDDPKNGWVPGDAIPHPQYADYAQFPSTYDVGVVLLKMAVAQPVYAALPPAGFLEGVKPRDNQFTVVGYGMQGYIKPFYEDTYARYQGSVRLVELNSTWNANLSAKYSNNPGTGGGSCYGDSGGPVFYGSTNMVVSVVSWGRTPCIGVDYQFRVDTPFALDFVRPYLR